MTHPFTVYFDTNFYVWLGRAADEDADRAIGVFNERHIRYVHSSYVVLELLSGRERSTQDQKLVARLKKWNIRPYPITLGYSNNGVLAPWDLLLLSDDDRKEYSEELKKIYDLETEARSFSHVADKPLTDGQKGALENALKPFHESIGIRDDSTDAEKASSYLRYSAEQLSQLKHFFSPEAAKKFDEIDFTMAPTPENLQDLAQKIKDILTDPVVSTLEQEVQLMNSVLALDDRPITKVIGQQSSPTTKKLGNSMRDAVHMNFFVVHRDQIDLLQVDSRQLSLVQRNKPEHFIRQRGLSSRCFSKPDLESTVKYLIDQSMGRE